MDLVIDTSAIIATIADEPERPALVELSSGYDLIAPLSVHFEIGNAFSAMIRRGKVGLERALQALESYQTIPIRFVMIEIDEALRLAAEHGTYAYDAYLLRCAQKYRCPLVTLDKPLRARARAMGLQVIEVDR